MSSSIYPYFLVNNDIIISNREKEISVSKATFTNKEKLIEKIKSSLGDNSILFNANRTTNITYKITDKSNQPVSENDLELVNSITTRHKYIDRIAMLDKLGYSIDFYSFDDNTFKLNLQVIDSDLP